MAAAEGKAQHPCSICEEPMASSEVHRVGSACAHAFCRTCLTGHVRAKVEPGGAGTVRCFDASCAGTVDPELCRAALPSDVFERWCAVLCESMFLGARRTYCPFPDCSEMMVVDDDDDCGGEGDAGRKLVMQSECQVCRRLFCAQCSVPWHAGADCAAYKRGDTSSEDVMLLEMATQKKWRRCPKCEFFVDKIDGCLHIVCRCEFEFCYGCGVEWGQRQSCSCPEDEEDNGTDEEDE